MGRGKIAIEKIENVSSRQVTFTKRKKALFKKAKDLSVLCDVHTAVIVFSATGRLYEFSTTSMKVLLDEYNREREETRLLDPTAEAKLWKVEVQSLRQEMEDLQRNHRQLLGEDVGQLSIQHLENIENQLQTSLKAIRAKKEQVMKERFEQLNQQENMEQQRKSISMQQEIAEVNLKKEPYRGIRGGAKGNFIDGENDRCPPTLELSLQLDRNVTH